MAHLTNAENIAIIAKAFGMTEEQALAHVLTKVASICGSMERHRLDSVDLKAYQADGDLGISISSTLFTTQPRRGGITDRTE